jgi:hypothetical protein
VEDSGRKAQQTNKACSTVETLDAASLHQRRFSFLLRPKSQQVLDDDPATKPATIPGTSAEYARVQE